MTTEFPQVTLWELTNGSDIVRLTSDLPANLIPVPYPTVGVWIDDEGWYYAPLRLNGFERALGAVPGITLSVDLVEYVRTQQQLNRIFRPGSIVTRYQTDIRAADTRNWSDNRNPYTTSVQRINHKTDRWTISRLRQQTNDVLTVELQNEVAFWTDVVRPNVKGRCYHEYRGAACGYKGNKFWDRDNKPVSARADDVCALSVKACELRFPTGDLRYGGNPFFQEET